MSNRFFLRAFAVRVLACIGALSLTLISVGVLALSRAGSWLNAPDNLETCDAIVVLSGAPERTMYAADLFQKGVASQVFIGNPARERSHHTLEAFGVFYPTETEVNRAILKQQGVPEVAIRTYGNASINTQEELEGIRAALPPSTRSFVIVTSPFHLRRTKILASNVFATKSVQIAVVAGPYEPYPDHWWQDQEAARQTISELAKISFYFLGGNFSATSQK